MCLLLSVYVCVSETDGGARSTVSISDFLIGVKEKKSLHLHSFLFTFLSFFSSIYLLLCLCAIKSAPVNLCTDISSCRHSCENPQKKKKNIVRIALIGFHWQLHCFSANIYRVKFLDWQIFPQVYYCVLLFFLTPLTCDIF